MAIFDNDSYDDEYDDYKMINALQQCSSNVKVGPRKSQREQRSSPARPMDKRTIASIAHRVKTGTMNLPDLNLESNEDYDAVWALVDSGAARSCARRRDHFPNTTTCLEPATVQMATASGEELKSRGTFRLEALSAEGNRIVQTFEDTDVDMPIMSVVELAANGELGSNIVFSKTDGSVVDIKSDASSKFIKRKGVYFMKIFVPRNRSGTTGFIRPGTA